jgi:hypothetical protein
MDLQTPTDCNLVACAAVIFFAPVTFFLAGTRRGEFCRIVPTDLDLIADAARPYARFEGTWGLHGFLQGPIYTWWTNVVRKADSEATPAPTLKLLGVPFGVVALLGIDSVCEIVFNRSTRTWNLNFKQVADLSQALEMKFETCLFWSKEGIQLEYTHRSPGEVNVTFVVGAGS